MADLMAIVSKAVFEKGAGKQPALGARLAMDRYLSTNKNLDPLAQGGRLYLVTVRPPNEELWLVAILDQPKHDGQAWVATACDTPITDISSLRGQITFESGTGITSKPGALGMSLQTPRALTAADTALLDAAAGAAAGAGPGASSAPPSSEDPSGASHASLLAAVIADPDSDDARRVYADLLAQRDDRRGEYIALALALEESLAIRRREQLAVRRDELYAAHAKQWFPYALPRMRVRRGFLDAVAGTGAKLKAAAPTLFAREPVVEVEVTDVDDEDAVEALLASRWLARIRRLIVRGAIGDDGFVQLCKSRQTANLRALNVTANELGADALAGMGSGLPRCRSLVLTSNQFGDEGIVGLRRWKHLAGIEVLYLSSCDLSAAGVAALLEGIELANLETICLNHNMLGDDIAGVFVAAAPRLPRLRRLELMATELSTEAAVAIAGALPSLRRLNARRNSIDAEVADEDPRVRTR